MLLRLIIRLAIRVIGDGARAGIISQRRPVARCIRRTPP